MSGEEAAYLAGIIDGEGCIDSPRGNPRIRIKMSDFDVIDRVAALMGAKTYHEDIPNRKPLLVAQITGQRAVDVLYAIRPWLGIRRAGRATDVIDAYEVRYPRPVLHLVFQEAA